LVSLFETAVSYNFVAGRGGGLNFVGKGGRTWVREALLVDQPTEQRVATAWKQTTVSSDAA
jgi:hypothetical protein